MTSQENEESTDKQEQRSLENWSRHFCGGDTLCSERFVEAVSSCKSLVSLSGEPEESVLAARDTVSIDSESPNLIDNQLMVG